MSAPRTGSRGGQLRASSGQPKVPSHGRHGSSSPTHLPSVNVSSSPGRTIRSNAAHTTRNASHNRNSTASRIDMQGSAEAMAQRLAELNEGLSEEVTTLHFPNEKDVLVTRRGALLGLAGAVGVVVAGAAAVALGKKDDEDELPSLDVPTASTTFADEYEQVEAEECLTVAAQIELPLGSLIWANSNDCAYALIPTSGANPLTQVAIIPFSSGDYVTLLEQAVGIDEGFEIYDVRGTSSGVIWTEADILDNVWRLYSATVTDNMVGEAVLLDEGDADWLMPQLTAVEHYGFWQRMPNPNGEKSTSDSVLYRASFGSSEPKKILASQGRFATAPYALEDAVIVTPRAIASSIYYRMTKIDAESGKIQEEVVLPSAMKPLEAGYGKNGFMFSLDAIYDYDDGLSYLGTFSPSENSCGKNYSKAPWTCFNRTPTAPPAWCDRFFLVKSTSAFCGLDMEARQFFAFDVDEGADTYGEYIASTGIRERIVTYTNIDYTPLSGSPEQLCRVKVYVSAENLNPSLVSDDEEEEEESSESTDTTSTDTGNTEETWTDEVWTDDTSYYDDGTYTEETWT